MLIHIVLHFTCLCNEIPYFNTLSKNTLPATTSDTIILITFLKALHKQIICNFIFYNSPHAKNAFNTVNPIIESVFNCTKYKPIS